VDEATPGLTVVATTATSAPAEIEAETTDGDTLALPEIDLTIMIAEGTTDATEEEDLILMKAADATPPRTQSTGERASTASEDMVVTTLLAIEGLATALAEETWAETATARTATARTATVRAASTTTASMTREDTETPCLEAELLAVPLEGRDPPEGR